MPVIRRLYLGDVSCEKAVNPGNSLRAEGLDELTIVIPSFEREPYLLAQLDFWGAQGVRVIAIDGSPSPLAHEFIDSLPTTTNYVHCVAPMVARLRLASTLITTRFVTLLADDDFHLPQALHDSVSALCDHSEVVCCIGQPMSYSLLQPGGVGIMQRYSDWRSASISDSEVQGRVRSHFNPYVPSCIYGVLRTEVFQRALSVLSTEDPRAFAQSELEFELAVSLLGQTMILGRLHWLRSASSTPSRNTESTIDRREMFFDWWLDKRRTRWKEEWIERMSRDIGWLANLDPVPLREIVTMTFEDYSVSQAQQRDRLRRIKLGLPPWIHRRFRILVRKLIHTGDVGVMVGAEEFFVTTNLLPDSSRHEEYWAFAHFVHILRNRLAGSNSV